VERTPLVTQCPTNIVTQSTNPIHLLGFIFSLSTMTPDGRCVAAFVQSLLMPIPEMCYAVHCTKYNLTLTDAVLLCVRVVALRIRGQTWVVVLWPLLTRPSTAVSVSRRASCLMLASSVVSICAACPPASRLSTCSDEPTCLVTASCVPHAAPLGSQLDVDSHPCCLFSHCMACCTWRTVLEDSL